MTRKLKDFSREQIYKIASEYATSPNHITAYYFCRAYNIKEGVFYNILKKAVIESIVSIDYVGYMKEKSAYNAYHHAENDGMHLSENNYDFYLEKRRTFHFNNKLTKQYAENYAKSPLSLKEFAKVNYMSPKLLESTLQRAIEENLVKEDTVIVLRLKALKWNASDRVNPFFDKMLEKRKEYIRLKRLSKYK